jgi:hypothetical protein
MPEIVTPFSAIYDVFMSNITDDMYMELTEAETVALQGELLLNAIPWFEFPRFNLDARNNEGFFVALTNEEIKILATYMIVEWLGQ